GAGDGAERGRAPDGQQQRRRQARIADGMLADAFASEDGDHHERDHHHASRREEVEHKRDRQVGPSAERVEENSEVHRKQLLVIDLQWARPPGGAWGTDDDSRRLSTQAPNSVRCPPTETPHPGGYSAHLGRIWLWPAVVNPGL